MSNSNSNNNSDANCPVGYNTYSYEANIDFQDEVNMNGISWNPLALENTDSNNTFESQLNQMANGTNNANDLGMFANCKYSNGGDNRCFLDTPEEVKYKLRNRNTWSNAVGEKVVNSSVSENHQIETTIANLAKRSLQEQRVTNSELLVKPLCEVYDCANKSKDDLNCKALNCLVCPRN